LGNRAGNCRSVDGSWEHPVFRINRRTMLTNPLKEYKVGLVNTFTKEREQDRIPIETI
jgi:hypothetical protein